MTVNDRVLITGGCGRVGRRLTERLTEQGVSVRVLDVVAGDLPAVEYLVGDITDPDLARTATRDVGRVIHLAAIPVENGRSHELFETNVHGAFEIMDAAAENGVTGFVFASTVAVYGMLHPSQPFMPEYFPIDEGVPVVPEKNYATGKIIGESYLQAYSRSHGMDGIVLRLATVMNPGAENWLRVVDDIDNPEHVFVRDRTMRDYMWQYVHVFDVVHAFQSALSYLEDHRGSGFDVFNIGAADCASAVPSLELIARYFPEVPLLKKPGSFAENPNAALFGIDKAREILGYAPRYTWRDQRAPEATAVEVVS